MDDLEVPLFLETPIYVNLCFSFQRLYMDTIESWLLAHWTSELIAIHIGGCLAAVETQWMTPSGFLAIASAQ